MKITALAFVAVAACVLAACAPNPPQRDAEAECTFLGTQEKAPKWACAPFEVAGYKDTGFGKSARSAAGDQFTLDQATLQARKSLTAQIQSRVKAGVSNAIRTAGLPGAPNETVDGLATSVAEQLTEERLAGSRVVRQAADSKGAIYVVVGMDVDTSQRVVQQAVQTSFANQSAQWQRVVGNRPQAEMQAEVLKMTNSR